MSVAGHSSTANTVSLPEYDIVHEAAPFDLFAEWLKEAELVELQDANAALLATVDATGLPNVRIVLLKGFGQDSFVFYTNSISHKGQEIVANPKAAMCFYWKSLRRQFRLRGLVEKVSDADADIYYASRPRGNQIGAWASKQSQPMASRSLLDKAVIKYTALYAFGSVPRPSWWCGFRIRPLSIEFWRERSFRLHERIEFCRDTITGPWKKCTLYP